MLIVKKLNLNKILEWLFYLFIFLLPWQTRWIFKESLLDGGAFEYGRMSLYSFDILLFIIGAFWVLGYIKVLILKRGNKTFSASSVKSFITSLLKQRPSIINVLLIGLGLYGLLSAIWSLDKTITFYWSLRILEGIILFGLIQKINFYRTRLIISFVLAGVVQSALATYQFLTQGVFSTKWLGLALHQSGDLGTSVVEFADQRWLRAYGAFPHPNILGGFLLLAFIFLIYLFFKYYKPQNTYTKKQNLFIPIFLYGSLVFITAGVFLSFSRAAWLGLVIILLGLIIYYYINVLIRKRRDGEKNGKANFFTVPSFSFMRPQVASIVIILWLILSIVYLPLVKTRLGIGDPGRLEVKSNTERISMTRQSLEIIKTNPVLGVGLGNYTHYLKQQYTSQPVWYYQPVHNTYLLIIAELGIIGFLILLLFNLRLLVGLITSYKNSPITNYQLPITNFLLLTSYFLLLFDHYFWTNASMWLVIWLIWGIIVKNQIFIPHNPPPHHS